MPIVKPRHQGNTALLLRYTIALQSLLMGVGACQVPKPKVARGSTAQSARPANGPDASSQAQRKTEQSLQTDALDAGKSRESSPASAIVAPLADVSSSEPAEVLPEPTYRTTNGGASKRGALFEQFAALTPAQCQKELRRRKIVVSRAGKPSPGVSTPLRIERNLGDVRWVTPNKKSVYGILDCRLIVALDELSKKLSTWEVKEVHVDNFYRPKSHLPGKKTKLSQHAHGLAVDIHALVLLDGTVLRIEEDFGGEQGGELCGPNAAFSSVTRKSVLLRNLVCNIANEGAFSYFLTPNYDAAHHNHLHGDIKRACRDHVAR